MTPTSPSGASPATPAALPVQTPGARAETWPGPATPLRWLATLALGGVVVGGLVGALAGAGGDKSTTVSASVQVVTDASALSGPLSDTVSNQQNDDAFVAGELSWLQAQERAQERADDSPATLAVSQVGTSNVLEIDATAADADDARTAAQTLLTAYVDRRTGAASTSLQRELDAVQARLLIIGTPNATSPAAQEYQRLLTEQSDLQAAQARVPGVAPVVSQPTVQEQSDGAPSWLLYGILGAVVGAVLALAAGAIWRATSKRLFDTRLLVAAGVPVLLPRLAAGSVRARTADVPTGEPTADALGAARALLPQVLGPVDGPTTLLVLGADERAGAAEAAWALAWALGTSGSPVTVLAAGADRETTVTDQLVVRGLPTGADELASAVAAGRTAGRTVVLLAPALSLGVPFGRLTGHADRAVVVVGEGVSSLEGALAAVRDVTSSATPLAGVAVTTSAKHQRPTAAAHRPQDTAATPAEEAAAESPSPRQETVAGQA